MKALPIKILLTLLPILFFSAQDKRLPESNIDYKEFIANAEHNGRILQMKRYAIEISVILDEVADKIENK